MIKNLQALAADGVWTLYQGDCDNKRITQASSFCFVKRMHSKEIM